eukprot:3640585-Alexandrium_andersonii.AAC.1
MAIDTNWPTSAESWRLAQRPLRAAQRKACTNCQAFCGRGASHERSPSQRAPRSSALKLAGSSS